MQKSRKQNALYIIKRKQMTVKNKLNFCRKINLFNGKIVPSTYLLYFVTNGF